MSMVEVCPKCGGDMASQYIIDPKTGEKHSVKKCKRCRWHSKLTV